MEMNKLTRILFTASIALFIFTAGIRVGEYRKQSDSVKSIQINKIGDRDFSLFWQVWNRLEEKYVDKKKIDEKKMYYGAIKGMVGALEDPYTFFLAPNENQQYKDDLEGKFSGIGAQLGLKNGQIVVIAPLKYSPAEKRGVRSGDMIYKVDGKSTENWSLPEAVSKIRGKAGTKVKLTLLRSANEIEVEITREEIKVSSVELTFENKIAILKLIKFGDDTTKEWDSAVDQINSKLSSGEITGMILDMRDNPGGYLQGAVYIASDFLPKGSLIVKQQYNKDDNEEYIVTRTPRLSTIPLAVLINKGSASASEIVAGAMRDHKRARLVGEKSFGKGSIQEAIDLKEGAGVHVTIAKWILPKGDWINGKGVEPDIKVENKFTEGNTLTREQDLQLEKAIDEVLK